MNALDWLLDSDPAIRWQLERNLMRRLSTGELVDPEILQLGFPPGYHYDVLRGLDYFRAANRYDDRLADAVAQIESKRGADGRWLIEVEWPDQLEIGAAQKVGQPSRWLTLQAMRVLSWAAFDRSASQ
jgi:hypothetical protein